MLKKIFFGFSVILTCCVVNIVSEPLRMVADSTAELFSEPSKSSLSFDYLFTGMECRVDSFFTDSFGIKWALIRSSGSSLWVEKKRLLFPDSIYFSGALSSTGILASDDSDKRRRLKILREHKEWSRRIINSVRNGEICYGMSSEQVEASWGKPLDKLNMFIVNSSTSEVWIYRSSDIGFNVVVFSSDKVVGWNTRK